MFMGFKLVSADFVQSLVAVESVSRHAHDFASLRNAAEHLGQGQQAQLVLNNRLIYNVNTGLLLLGW